MKKRYTIYCPVQEIWVMEADAESPEEALRMIREGGAYQKSSHAGTTKSGLDEIVSVSEISEEE